MGLVKAFKYEARNLLRSHFIWLSCLLITALGVVFIRLTGDFTKATLALFSILSVTVPLLSLLYSCIYWYYSDRYTQLILAMPIKRRDFFWARWLALVLVLSGCVCIGFCLSFAFYSGLSKELFLTCLYLTFLVLVFTSIGLLVANLVSDRMKGLGLALGVWAYFTMVHDGLLLLLLIALKNYPMDLASAILAAINPIGLARLITLLNFDAALLLSQTGALMRQLITSWHAYAVAAIIALCWLVTPTWLAKRSFERCDF